MRSLAVCLCILHNCCWLTYEIIFPSFIPLTFFVFYAVGVVSWKVGNTFFFPVYVMRSPCCLSACMSPFIFYAYVIALLSLCLYVPFIVLRERAVCMSVYLSSLFALYAVRFISKESTRLVLPRTSC
jgi:hypothetical protein